MSFVRAKEIPPGSGNWYDYEVKTITVKGQPRQKVIRYIGKSSRTSMLRGGGGMTRESVMLADTTPSPAPATPIESKARIPKMKTPSSLIASAMGMYYGGMSLDGIEQQFKQDHDLNMSESNYWDWVKRFTKEAVRCKSSLSGRYCVL